MKYPCLLLIYYANGISSKIITTSFNIKLCKNALDGPYGIQLGDKYLIFWSYFP